jgi:hypothetical protein
VVERHYGSRDRPGVSIYPQYCEWLPKSGASLRDFPLYFHYLSLMPETAELDLSTEIYLPLQLVQRCADVKSVVQPFDKFRANGVEGLRAHRFFLNKQY